MIVVVLGDSYTDSDDGSGGRFNGRNREEEIVSKYYFIIYIAKCHPHPEIL